MPNRNRRACPIDKHLVAGLVLLAQHHVELRSPPLQTSQNREYQIAIVRGDCTGREQLHVRDLVATTDGINLYFVAEHDGQFDYQSVAPRLGIATI